VSTDNDMNGGHTLMSGSIWRVDVHAHTASVIVNAIGRPRGMALLPDGRLALADDLHHVVELLDPATAKLTVLAGTWDQKGMVDAAGAAARFSTPYGLAVRSDGQLVIADFDNNRLRLVSTSGAVSTLSGGGAGFTDGAMTAAQFSNPQAVAVDGDTIYVTDLGNYRIRRIKGGVVDTVAGDGKAGWLDADDPLDGELYGLEGMAAAGGMLYVSDGNRGEAVPHNYVRTVKVPQ
jgi:sugar lactone lactonase YvrE